MPANPERNPFRVDELLAGLTQGRLGDSSTPLLGFGTESRWDSYPFGIEDRFFSLELNSGAGLSDAIPSGLTFFPPGQEGR